MTPYPWAGRHARAFAQALLRERGAQALPELLLRGALSTLAKRTWEAEPDARLPTRAMLIVGHQRSGTTFLHRLLALHPSVLTLPLHALILPADSIQRRFSGPRPAWLDRLQDRMLGPLDPLHRLRLHEPEEDEFALWSSFRTEMCALDRPWQHAPPCDGDEVAVQYWAQLVARAVRRQGGVYVGKNPHFSWRIPEVRRALPGVLVVGLWRDPAEAIASRLSLITHIWRARVPGFTQLSPAQRDRILASSARIYGGALGQTDVDLAYQALIDDPQGTVNNLFERLGLGPLPDQAAAKLTPNLRAGRSPHRYSLEEFGVTPAQLKRALPAQPLPFSP